jgi:hypothetical protein
VANAGKIRIYFPQEQKKEIIRGFPVLTHRLRAVKGGGLICPLDPDTYSGSPLKENK